MTTGPYDGALVEIRRPTLRKRGQRPLQEGPQRKDSLENNSWVNSCPEDKYRRGVPGEWSSVGKHTAAHVWALCSTHRPMRFQGQLLVVWG